MPKRLFAILFVAFISGAATRAQIINTIAGNGTQGFSGDGGPATSAEFNTPTDVAVGSNGAIYIADRLNYRVRKIDGAGIVSTVAGTGAAGYNGDGIIATSAEINNVWSIAVDNIGNLYLADADNNRVRKVDTAGVIYTVAGDGTAGYSGDGGPATTAQLSSPVSVTLDDSGNLYIADYNNYSIRKVNTAGVISTYAGTGVGGYTGDGGPATSATFGRLGGMAFDKFGNLFIADDNSRIREVNSSGIINTVAGNGTNNYNGDGIPATTASIAGAVGVAVDTNNNFFIVDAGHYRIRKVDNTGLISTIAGVGTSGFSGDGGNATAAQLIAAQMRVLANGDIYIADVGNNRIRVILNALHTGNFKSTDNDFELFPNANNGSFTVTGEVSPVTRPLPVQIMDIRGMVVCSDVIQTQAGRIHKHFELGNIPPGYYVFKILTGQGTASIGFEKR